MRKPLTALVATLSALALLSACAGAPATGGTAATPSPTPVASATPTPSPTEELQGILSSFATTDLEGNAADQTIFADYDLTMVNIWATFCSPCLDEMPDLGEIHAEYADKGFQVVGLVSDTLNQDGTISDSQVDTAKLAVESTEAAYLHLLPSQDLFSLLSQATSVPTTLFVDKNGAQVGSAYVGSRSKDAWVTIIDSMLEEVAK